MPLVRRPAFNTRVLADAASFAHRSGHDFMQNYSQAGVLSGSASGNRTPYLHCIPQGTQDREATAAIMTMRGLSPFSWVLRATTANKVRFVHGNERSCYVRGVPAYATLVEIADYYQPAAPHPTFPDMFLPKRYRSSLLSGQELLNVYITSPSDRSFQEISEALSRYISTPQRGAGAVDYVVIAFQLKEALRLGARIYIDCTAVIGNAYMLALPFGREVLAEVKTRGLA